MIALRLVIATDIVVSAALKPHELQRTVQLLAYRKALRKQLLQLIKNRTHVVRHAPTLRITSDPDDNRFLAQEPLHATVDLPNAPHWLPRPDHA